MKKGLIWGVGIAAVGVGAYLYFKRQIALLQDFKYKIVGLRIKKLTKEEISFDLKTRFYSKASIEAKITKIYIDVFVEGVNAGYITENKEFIIPAKGYSDIDLSFSFNPQVVIKNIVNIVLAGIGKKDLSIEFKGFASIKSGLIATTLKIDYKTTLKNYLTD